MPIWEWIYTCNLALRLVLTTKLVIAWFTSTRGVNRLQLRKLFFLLDQWQSSNMMDEFSWRNVFSSSCVSTWTVQSFSEHIGNDNKKVDFTETNKLSTEINHSALIAQMWACRNCLRQSPIEEEQTYSRDGVRALGILSHSSIPFLVLLDFTVIKV